MKALFSIMLLCATSVACAQESGVSNGDMPKGYPSSILVAREPFGSGTPAVGVTSGYEKALAVGNGLYHVPNYLPGSPSSFPIDPRVVQLECKSQDATWVCNGYSFDPQLSQGEYILIQPLLK